MAYTRAVAVVLGSLLALTQTEVVRADGGSSHVYTSSVGASSSGAAQSQFTESDGTTVGQCAYMDTNGNSIKISYKQHPNGQLEAEAKPPMRNAAEALKTCRRAAEAAAKVASESIQRTNQEIFRQNQVFQSQFPGFFPIHPNFPFGGFNFP